MAGCSAGCACDRCLLLRRVADQQDLIFELWVRLKEYEWPDARLMLKAEHLLTYPLPAFPLTGMLDPN